MKKKQRKGKSSSGSSAGLVFRGRASYASSAAREEALQTLRVAAAGAGQEALAEQLLSSWVTMDGDDGLSVEAEIMAPPPVTALITRLLEAMVEGASQVDLTLHDGNASRQVKR